MIIDAVMFNDEIDMLDFRLNLLWDYVDKFIIVEADHTHSGKKKDSNFLKHQEMFEWAEDKIIYRNISIDINGLDLNAKPKSYDPKSPQWVIENSQRNSIIDACEEFSDDDILILSDCDEIPSRDTIEYAGSHRNNLPFSCKQAVLVYNLRYYCKTDWRGSVFSTVGQARAIGTQKLRDSRNIFLTHPYAGWHLSYFGGAKQVKNKLESFAHQELNKPEFTDIGHIQKAIDSGGSIFNEKTSGKIFHVDKDFFPDYFIQHAPQKWFD